MDAATYNLFGMIELPEGVTVPREPEEFLLVNFSIPNDINLFFHHGDVVGYYQPDNLRAKIWTIQNSSYTAYRERVSNYTTAFDISSGSVQTKGNRQPLIHVIYGKCIFSYLCQVHVASYLMMLIISLAS